MVGLQNVKIICRFYDFARKPQWLGLTISCPAVCPSILPDRDVTACPSHAASAWRDPPRKSRRCWGFVPCIPHVHPKLVEKQPSIPEQAERAPENIILYTMSDKANHSAAIAEERAKSNLIYREAVAPGLDIVMDLKAILCSAETEFQKVDILETYFGKVRSGFVIVDVYYFERTP